MFDIMSNAPHGVVLRSLRPDQIVTCAEIFQQYRNSCRANYPHLNVYEIEYQALVWTVQDYHGDNVRLPFTLEDVRQYPIAPEYNAQHHRQPSFQQGPSSGQFGQQ